MFFFLSKGSLSWKKFLCKCFSLIELVFFHVYILLGPSIDSFGHIKLVFDQNINRLNNIYNEKKSFKYIMNLNLQRHELILLLNLIKNNNNNNHIRSSPYPHNTFKSTIGTGKNKNKNLSSSAYIVWFNLWRNIIFCAYYCYCLCLCIYTELYFILYHKLYEQNSLPGTRQI